MRLGFIKKNFFGILAFFRFGGKTTKPKRDPYKSGYGALGFNGWLSVLLLFLSAGCPPKTPEPKHGLEDNFHKKEARTLYGIDQFQISAPVEYLQVSEGEVSPAENPAVSGSAVSETTPSAEGSGQPWWSSLGSFPVTEVAPHSAEGEEKGKWVKTSLHPSFLEQITDNKDLQSMGQFKVKVRDEKSGAVREAIVRRVLEDWAEATALTEEDLAGMGALRIRTSSGGEEVKNSISQVGAFIDPNSKVSFINRYYLVDYTTPDVKLPKGANLESVKDDPKKLLAFLFGEVNDFHGFPDTDYYILPRLEGNYLILYRLGRPNKIPFDERSMAYRVGDYLATPLVGYPLEYCVPDKHETAHFEKTDLDVAVCEGVSMSSAKYVRFQTMGKQVFSYQPKLDIFPADFFKGKWFYLRTIVRTSERDAGSIGHHPFVSSHLVEFRKTPQHLEVVDASGYEVDDEDKVTAVFIPVKWKEYEMDRNADLLKSFSEREKTKTPDVKRPYFQLDFHRLTALEVGGDSKLKAVVGRVYITDAYFSFDIEVNREAGYPFVVRYTFKKTEGNQSYPERAWYKEDTDKFMPVFASARRYYSSSVDATTKDREKFMRANRFDPGQEVIRWHFSAQTSRDKWVRDFGRHAVEYQNKMFKEAARRSGRKHIEIVLDESEDKPLGSLGNNIINLVVTESQTAIGAYGFGPNVSNPITGEVVGATANVWVSSVLDGYITKVRQYIRIKIWPPSWKFLSISNGVSAYLEKRIEDLCPEVGRFIESQKGRVILHPTRFIVDGDEDKRVQVSCGRKLAEPAILWTVLHEMHHGFGFRHVFGGSSDRENFYTSYEEMKGIFGDGILNVETEGFKGPARYASVMDYANLDYPILTVPGEYDIGAVRYLYFDEVELRDGKTLVLSGEGSILEQARAQGVDEDQIKYRACNLSHLDTGRISVDSEDPLCAKFDYGSTPKEIVEIKIRDTQDFIVGAFRRYDRTFKRFDLDGKVVAPDMFFAPYLIKWRKLLNGLFAKSGKHPLDYSSFSEKDIKEYEEIIEAEAAQNEEFRSYYEIIPVLSDFMERMLTIPFKRCIYERPDETFYSVNLEVIRSRIAGDYPSGSRELFMNCKSESVQKWAKETGAGEFVTEVGIFAQNREYFINPLKTDPWDEMSISDLIVLLNSVQKLTLFLGFEPGFRRHFFEFEKENWLKGQDINPYINDSPRIREVREERGLSVNCRPLQSSPNLPECEPLFPRFSINELQEKYFAPPGIPVFHKSLASVQSLSSQIIVGSQSERIRVELKRAFSTMRVNDIASFQTKVTNLTQNPSRALTNMSNAFETQVPFIYQSYEDYVREHDTPEKQNETSFIAFLRGLSSVISFEESGEFIMPFIKGGVMEEGFRKYNSYKACIAKEECADRQEKKSFIQLTNNRLGG